MGIGREREDWRRDDVVGINVAVIIDGRWIGLYWLAAFRGPFILSVVIDAGGDFQIHRE